MHISAEKFVKKFIDIYLNNKINLKILDFGSYNVNGNIKNFVSKNHNYLGVDINEGPNVDIIMKDQYIIPLETNSIDVVISTSVFEHTEMFWLSFNEIMRVLKPNGLFYLNAPSNGPYHAWPFDCYRFYPDSASALAKWANISGYKNVIMIESFTGMQDQDVWNDFVSIFIKDKNFISEYPNRIITSKKIDFYNGKLFNSEKIIKESIFTEDQFYKPLKYISKSEYLFYRAINKLLKFLNRYFFKKNNT